MCPFYSDHQYKYIYSLHQEPFENITEDGNNTVYTDFRQVVNPQWLNWNQNKATAESTPTATTASTATTDPTATTTATADPTATTATATPTIQDTTGVNVQLGRDIRQQQALGAGNILTKTGATGVDPVTGEFDPSKVEMLYDPIDFTVKDDELRTDQNKLLDTGPERALLSDPEFISNVQNVATPESKVSFFENIEKQCRDFGFNANTVNLNQNATKLFEMFKNNC